jgi:alkyl hydroperoxide reductase subunit AhpC
MSIGDRAVIPERPDNQLGYKPKTPFPVLADPDREVYHSFDLEKAHILIQRTASVIVDRHGIIRYLKRATNPH